MKWTYFTEEEFACKCGCGTGAISPELVDILDDARVLAGFPFIITSGVRCPAQNAAEGGKPESAHVKGLAADIACASDAERYALLRIFFLFGFRRIGIGRDFIHVDISRELPGGVAWLY